MESNKFHEPVLVHEILENLHIENQARVIDATLGTAGHTIEFLKKGFDVLAIERDPKLLKIAEKRLISACPSPNSNGWGTYKLVLGNFSDIENIASENDFADPDIILMDLGISNLHYKDRERGFSFEEPDASLDMRLNSEKQGVSAADLLNLLRKDQLIDLFSYATTKGKAQNIAKKVIDYRQENPFRTVSDLKKALTGVGLKSKINELTLPMMALRIAVNSELDNLENALPDSLELLKKGGRLMVISFHSGEDRIVKRMFKKAEMANKGKVLTNKPITPGKVEIGKNRKARSAKLRIIEKI